jgi:hypothetical protein
MIEPFQGRQGRSPKGVADGISRCQTPPRAATDEAVSAVDSGEYRFLFQARICFSGALGHPDNSDVPRIREFVIPPAIKLDYQGLHGPCPARPFNQRIQYPSIQDLNIQDNVPKTNVKTGEKYGRK